jgi:molecular chaperone GrpE
MSSNVGNKEASQSAAEDEVFDGEVVERDRRIFSPDGDPVEEHEELVEIHPEIEQLQSKLNEADAKRIEAEIKVKEFAERFRQAQAQLKNETDELRARLQRNFDQKLETARGDLIAGLLDTLDNLKRAVAAAEKSDRSEKDFNALLDGIQATANLFESKMLSLGLTAVPSVGEEFNPEIHEAVEIVPVKAARDNQVIDELQTGYKFGERLLRPARVRVGRAS